MGHAQRHHNNMVWGYVEGEVGSCLIVNQNSSQLNKHPTTLVGNPVLPVLPGKTVELRRFSSTHNTTSSPAARLLSFVLQVFLKSFSDCSRGVDVWMCRWESDGLRRHLRSA